MSDRPGDESDSDPVAVRALVDRFFAAFTSGSGLPERMSQLRSLFVDDAVVVRALSDGTTVYDVDSFIEPRRALLESGDLLDFEEWPVAGRVDVFGDIAQWFGSYRKSGLLDGSPLTGAGMKSIQCVKVGGRWRICAVAWCDERDGLALTDHQHSDVLSAPARSTSDPAFRGAPPERDDP